jgi:tryptophanyl-tRNA synthetase
VKLQSVLSKGLLSRPKTEDDRFGGARLGLFAYPVLQAADILLYKYLLAGDLANDSATHVPVGDDQAQHLEATRKLAHLFNNAFPAIPETFNIPETLISIHRLQSIINLR